MKKIILTSVLSLVFLISVTGCGGNENSQVNESSHVAETVPEERRIYQTGEPVTEPEFDIVEMQDIQELIDSVGVDPNFNVNTMFYEIYIEKVMVYGSDFDKDDDNIQLIVGSIAEIPAEDKTIYKTIAAEKDFYDVTRPKGPEMDSCTLWKFEKDSGYYAWSAESIIESALNYLGISENDMEMYKRYTIHSTFPE